MLKLIFMGMMAHVRQHSRTQCKKVQKINFHCYCLYSVHKSKHALAANIYILCSCKEKTIMEIRRPMVRNLAVMDTWLFYLSSFLQFIVVKFLQFNLTYVCVCVLDTIKLLYFVSTHHYCILSLHGRSMNA